MREGLQNHSRQAGALEAMVEIARDALVAASGALGGRRGDAVRSQVRRAIEQSNDLLTRIKVAENEVRAGCGLPALDATEVRQ